MLSSHNCTCRRFKVQCSDRELPALNCLSFYKLTNIFSLIYYMRELFITEYRVVLRRKKERGRLAGKCGIFFVSIRPIGMNMFTHLIAMISILLLDGLDRPERVNSRTRSRLLLTRKRISPAKKVKSVISSADHFLVLRLL